MSRVDKIGFIGGGKVAAGLISALQGSECEILLLVEGNHQVEQILLESESVSKISEAGALLEQVDCLFITTRDATIAQIDSSLPWQPRHLAVHTSGALPAAALRVAAQAGAAVASLHPPITVTSAERAVEQFSSLPLICEGDQRAVDFLRTLTSSFADPFIELNQEEKRLHHLACMFSSNFISILQWRADQLWRRLGFAEELRRDLICRFVSDYAVNLGKGNYAGAVSGPLTRGDIETVKEHRELLQNLAEEMQEDFHRISIRTLEMLIAESETGREQKEAWLLQLEQLAERDD